MELKSGDSQVGDAGRGVLEKNPGVRQKTFFDF